MAKKPDEAIKLAKEGLIANPNDLILRNNLAFSYLRSNHINEAESVLNTFPRSLPEHEQIFFLATSGLLNYKKGDINLGRSLYLRSIDLCRKKHDKRLIAKASLYLALAELESNTETAIKFSETALEISEGLSYPDIIIPRLFVSEML
jgi:tetratricopeptide (TPR) repeat protein